MPGYEDNELADGSDDEKRLYKAKLQAGRKDQPNRKWNLGLVVTIPSHLPLVVKL